MVLVWQCEVYMYLWGCFYFDRFLVYVVDILVVVILQEFLVMSVWLYVVLKVVCLEVLLLDGGELVVVVELNCVLGCGWVKILKWVLVDMEGFEFMQL